MMLVRLPRAAGATPGARSKIPPSPAAVAAATPEQG
ncbi:hypothetical protein CBM2599_A30050 [Cupriavidus taiwanensis]|uniref:Uncharacterized protein n=1 Tax=Cupriavidus taiwanensis TaxID=164546 RepID=A0A976AJB5_9BURK|nr:hypothetical protein CBM2599_A30050 [Cupriavidus taiwanensis]SOY88237.1 hypothetical protein CBM2600_A30051 [Cupriavidus taiwanensis]SPD63193.1 protein of unknown function [Cupriavidus taiwanensis]